MTRSKALSALSNLLGSGRLLTEERLLRRYRGIAWGEASAKIPLPRALSLPIAVARPRHTDDVVAIVRWANETGTPLVPYGSGTGVHGGASPVEGAVVLDLGAMQRVISIDRQDQAALVEAGTVLGELDQEAATHELMVGHDPWSQPLASVGGAVSTNGVGYLAGKYGPMGDQVIGLEVVLANGEVLRTRPVPKSSTGPALRHLFIGAEGLFGVITRIDLRLFPVPERRALLGYRFPRFEDGLEAALEMAGIQLRPSMIDYEEDEPEPSQLRLGELVDLPSAMFLAFEGFTEEVEAQVKRVEPICLESGGRAMERTEIDEFWETRHESAERYKEQLERDPEGLALRRRRQWSSTYVNIGLPTSTILEYRRRAAEELRDYGLAVKASGIWGIPELFSVKFQHLQPTRESAVDELEAGTDRGLRIAQELGGSMEYCHGVGVRLAHLMGDELGTGMEVVRGIKRALDPKGILNPGKLGI